MSTPVSRINDHEHSVIGKHLPDVHNLRNKDLCDQFTILKKYLRRLDCSTYEMFFSKTQKNLHLILNLTPIKGKRFISQFKRTTLGILFIDTFFTS